MQNRKESSEKILNEEQLDELLSRPGPELIELIKHIDGDIIFLGIAGKMGPTLARMAKRACEQAGLQKRVIGVSRFRSEEEIENIRQHGIEIFRGDLLDPDFIHSLPKIKNVFFLAGMKFGSEENLSLTWAVNTYVPAMVAGHFKDSRIVAFSTGCVYPLVPIDSGGSIETDSPVPVGEYAQSCLGRERMFEYGSKKNGTLTTLIRLNYSVELRYGVLVDIAARVRSKQVIDLSMGYFNAIWQGDANDMILRSIDKATSPARVLNVTGHETLSVREVAGQFGRIFDIEPIFTGNETSSALLSNSRSAFDLFGRPRVEISQVIQWIAQWLLDHKKLLGKPTHYEVRDGKY